MRKKMTFQMQLFFSLCTALLLGWICQPTPGETVVIRNPTETPIPVYRNLTGGWEIHVRYHQSKPPEIISISKLEKIRLTSTANTGEYTVKILNENGGELFSQKFQIYFLRTGSSQKLETIEQILLIPQLEGAIEIVIDTPQGEIRYAIPQE